MAVMVIAASAQSAQQTELDILQKRIAELESQLRSISEELERLRQEGTNKVDRPVIAETKPNAENETSKAPESAARSPVQPSGIRITPYGSIYFNVFSNTGGTNNADVPLFATPTGRGNAGASLRQTRLGLRIEGARVGEANLGAVIEGDFFGGFPAVGIGENFGIVRLRLAYIKIDREKTSLTVGQDWMVFAPQNPTSLAAAAIPQMAAAGNNWARLPQVKVEHRLSNEFRLLAAVLSPQTGDSNATASFFLQPNSGSVSRLPFFQSRLAFTGKDLFGSAITGTIGVSGHFGRSAVFVGSTPRRYDIDSFGIAADWNIPLARRVSLAGEAFTGKNLAGFQGGVFQGYNLEFPISTSGLTAAAARGIRTSGGWMQLGFTPPAANDKISLFGSFGIDDPNDRDLLTISPRDLRLRNLAWAFDAIYRFTPQFSAGLEYRGFVTHWTLSGRRRSDHVNLGAVYTF
ncbi:MAG TPA: hypothetical protein PKD26_12695 [Pyrinomonadaceae bacterium]|nr:hypothetical protein [Pyrinomonadaceae bacterium]